MKEPMAVIRVVEYHVSYLYSVGRREIAVAGSTGDVFASRKEAEQWIRKHKGKLVRHEALKAIAETTRKRH